MNLNFKEWLEALSGEMTQQVVVFVVQAVPGIW